MVQITNALLFAATVAPAFAAPLETREPKFNVAVLKAVGKGVAKATSGADTTANLVSVTPQQPQRRSIDGFEDVEARDPRLSGAQIRQAGRVAGKVASGVGAAATVGSLLMPQQRRSLESREPGITSAQAKSFFKGAVKVGGYAKSGIEFGTTVAPLLPHKNRRSLEDLEVRTFRMPSHSTMRAIGGTVAGAAGFAGT
ncbi:hypothetical protein HYPSUDRAFT_412463 [Hypholoma sublateritium FD-334 SS-4]|uniref:Uncharacterized protein n=1 Tax=Hypholoma sublateritium (strain FD-334 SS-4) TaxID=945553 RepID=A0A0D2LVQ8_HYPSF|nr:hypothetical protein HYPSUDRAFT_412463 [Hypholoma sublateritium FD-334 SS-4]